MLPVGRLYAASVGTGVVARYVSQAPITSTGTVRHHRRLFGRSQRADVLDHVRQPAVHLHLRQYRNHVSVEELRTTTVAALGNIPLAEDGREILVRAGGYPGLAEVFLASGDQLERYVALNAVGLPVTLNDLIFAETRFRYEAQVSVTITETEFRRIGCSGPFPLFAPVEQAQAVIPLTTTSPFSRRSSFVMIGVRCWSHLSGTSFPLEKQSHTKSDYSGSTVIRGCSLLD